MAGNAQFTGRGMLAVTDKSVAVIFDKPRSTDGRAQQCHLRSQSVAVGRNRSVDDLLRLCKNEAQVFFAFETLAVDLVDVLGALRTRR